MLCVLCCMCWNREPWPPLKITGHGSPKTDCIDAGIPSENRNKRRKAMHCDTINLEASCVGRRVIPVICFWEHLQHDTLRDLSALIRARQTAFQLPLWPPIMGSSFVTSQDQCIIPQRPRTPGMQAVDGSRHCSHRTLIQRETVFPSGRNGHGLRPLRIKRWPSVA